MCVFFAYMIVISARKKQSGEGVQGVTGASFLVQVMAALSRERNI